MKIHPHQTGLNEEIEEEMKKKMIKNGKKEKMEN